MHQIHQKPEIIFTVDQKLRFQEYVNILMHNKSFKMSKFIELQNQKKHEV